MQEVWISLEHYELGFQRLDSNLNQLEIVIAKVSGMNANGKQADLQSADLRVRVSSSPPKR